MVLWYLYNFKQRTVINKYMIIALGASLKHSLDYLIIADYDHSWIITENMFA